MYMDSNGNDVFDSGEWSDWEWYGPEGNLVAETDSEFRRYRYGQIVNQYNRDVKRSLPQQYQISAAFGLDFYHYSKTFGCMHGAMLCRIIKSSGTGNTHTVGSMESNGLTIMSVLSSAQKLGNILVSLQKESTASIGGYLSAVQRWE